MINNKILFIIACTALAIIYIVSFHIKDNYIEVTKFFPMECTIQDDWKAMEKFTQEHNTNHWGSSISYYFINGTKIENPQRECSYSIQVMEWKK